MLSYTFNLFQRYAEAVVKMEELVCRPINANAVTVMKGSTVNLVSIQHTFSSPVLLQKGQVSKSSGDENVQHTNLSFISRDVKFYNLLVALHTFVKYYGILFIKYRYVGVRALSRGLGNIRVVARSMPRNILGRLC